MSQVSAPHADFLSGELSCISRVINRRMHNNSPDKKEGDLLRGPPQDCLKEALAFAKLFQLNPFIGGVRLGDIAGAAYHALNTRALELPRLRTVGDLFGL